VTIAGRRIDAGCASKEAAMSDHDIQGKPSKAEGEDPDEVDEAVVGDIEGHPSQAEGEDEA